MSYICLFLKDLSTCFRFMCIDLNVCVYLPTGNVHRGRTSVGILALKTEPRFSTTESSIINHWAISTASKLLILLKMPSAKGNTRKKCFIKHYGNSAKSILQFLTYYWSNHFITYGRFITLYCIIYLDFYAHDFSLQFYYMIHWVKN